MTAERDRLIALAHGVVDAWKSSPVKDDLLRDRIADLAAALSQPHSSEQGAAPDEIDHALANVEDIKRAAPHAPAPVQAAPSPEQGRMLAQALGECLIAAGIVRKDASLSGPELLMFAEDLKRVLATPAQPVEADTLTEAVKFLRMALDFAYQQGLHEVGYDPLSVVASALAARAIPAPHGQSGEQEKATEGALTDEEIAAVYHESIQANGFDVYKFSRALLAASGHSPPRDGGVVAQSQGGDLS